MSARGFWKPSSARGQLYTSLVCGQEFGSKTEHIQGTARRYPRNHVLMVGDAPGDLQAAKANDVLFYPVVPGEEEASWEWLSREGLDRFFEERYAGQYEFS